MEDFDLPGSKKTLYKQKFVSILQVLRSKSKKLRSLAVRSYITFTVLSFLVTQ